MERLTKYSEINKDYITPHCDNFNCNGCCRDCDYEQVIINKLSEYENFMEVNGFKSLEQLKNMVSKEQYAKDGLDLAEQYEKIKELKHDLAVRDLALDLIQDDEQLFQLKQYYLDYAEEKLKGDK